MQARVTLLETSLANSIKENQIERERFQSLNSSLDFVKKEIKDTCGEIKDTCDIRKLILACLGNEERYKHLTNILLRTGKECMVCCSRESNAVLQPCSHGVFVCGNCITNPQNPISQCPMCRVDILSFQIIYNVG